MQIKEKSTEELIQISNKIRERIIDVVSRKGGHFSSTLGAVELTLGMHKVFDVRKDPFIFDVSHQCYAHKLLTNRWEEFETVRQFDGMCGFTKPKESDADYFVAGHSSTSISIATGAAKAIKLKNEDRVPVVMIGDGSMSAGMVYEAMNELGDLKLPVVIILNDNEMSIAKPIGAISKYLSKILAGKFYQSFKARVDKFIRNNMPEGTTYLAKRVENSIKLITPGILFEELGIDYIGPIDGHDIEEIIDTLTIAKSMNKPVIVHARTTKGKGYKIAEGQHEEWHGVGPFNIEDGEFIKKSSDKSATAVYSDALLNLAEKYDNVVGVTAAMPSGTGLDKLLDKFPDRFWDVAIAEQHAVTSMAAMAKEGFKPFVTIYSTFLQRGFDQIVHDVCIMGLPVVFAMDRAGIVGNDGETHQGVFDISFLRFIPNMVLFAPRDNQTLNFALDFAYSLDKPCAIRYPRGAFKELDYKANPFVLGKSELLKDGKSNKLFIAYGAGVSKAIEVEKLHEEDIAILDLRFVKPLDKDMLIKLSEKYNSWYIFSDSQKQGGVASAILELLSEENILNISVNSFEYNDIFIEHGDTKLVEKSLELLADQLVKKVI
ncbi:1-deoxy-D-xylulose-5-phosphate synthase [Aliarcobacter thereius]|uniref:1-deoxy-D-xylulose-5-phosphate synthase n=2 Tax=Aliarcobacter thereius TaxID=544718 RepID=A0A1C0B8I8_9BACT|nr:1-deoxy-D-xylulose-5-phosphate synthase [Aliarcobacter thereius]OCL93782.1 1-deoxy-D-xylulose-5-phosphate synthase [Aliarcobacter thereius]OCL95190.1 1-deoxy-D-xylulose-5-phosphate synthase [Aliarcobacter thereius LMG 24486]OCL99916.1 1-deoxy-D-xylulose-5-phosphate synthase [Aliarcobacter thereius]QBF16820.1 1-deoxyxylulose-5-phosphate synthase [Aliarcobacter thereius LMG 24486]TLS73279.1 1-deoxy-D-xylulose-5-phosphate synthase [Aliarcobacter thereius]